MTRVFVYLTLAVVKEMYSFLIVMGYSVFSFRILLSIILEHKAIGELDFSFRLVVGGLRQQ